MSNLRIGLLNKKRGNFTLQGKFAGTEVVVDETYKEVAHHEKALTEAGYDVVRINWGSSIINDIKVANVDIVFNVSSLVEAAILEELEIPYVGSDPFAIALATDKSLAKRIWQHAGLPTSPFYVARTKEDCLIFRRNSPFEYPLFIKPIAGRGSAGITEESVIESYDQLVSGVVDRYETIGQPVLIERFLKGIEITFGVLGNDDDIRVLPPLEIVYKDGALTLTYDKKEIDDDNFFCPARLRSEEVNEMQLLVTRAYKALGFRDYGRIDTILTEEGPFLLEGNSFAGLMCTPKEKPHSYIGFMSVAEGKNGKELLDEIVQSAIKRYNFK